jgi:hypothetical protein
VYLAEWKNGEPEEDKMPETVAHNFGDPEIAEQKLWRAVIANTIDEWLHGPLRLQREAEQFLFYDDDFHTVCLSAGMNPEYLRERLRRFGHLTIQKPSDRVAELVVSLAVPN